MMFGIFILLIVGGDITATLSQDMLNLKASLFANYSKYSRPVREHEKVLNVDITFHLMVINSLDEKGQVLTMTGWFHMVWTDDYLAWNEDEYGGIGVLLVPQEDIWKPDIIVDNTAKEFKYLGFDEMLVYVESDGTVYWSPGAVFDTVCKLDLTKYPFDEQTCYLKLVTWNYYIDMLNMTTSVDGFSQAEFTGNGQWDLGETRALSLHIPDTYGDLQTGVTFSMTLKRKRSFFIVNTVFPVMMLSVLNVVVFLLPAESGEKMSLSVTVLLAIAVFLTLMSETMPQTSDHISVMGVYIACLLAFSTLAILISVACLHVRYQDEAVPIPSWLQSFARRRKRFTHKNITPKQILKDKQAKISPLENTKLSRIPIISFTVGDQGKELFEHSQNEHISNEKESPTKEDGQVTWTDVGKSFDWLFFWVFLSSSMFATFVCLCLLLS